ncbi:MAG: hopanoid biosynthesis-associated protein HpnK [Candidatus Binataceae bacterium]
MAADGKPATPRTANRKAVIVTGDDFGRSREVNAGILHAYREGVLRGTSLMVAGAARDEAAALAHANPGLDVGLHLVLCRGFSALAPAQLSPIVDMAGRFADSSVMGGMNYFFRRSLRPLLRDEIRAQIELHLKLVGYLNHIDGHLNFHVHPVVADLMVELASEYRVPCIRLPREPVLTTLGLARDHAPRKLVESLIFRALSRRTRRMLDEHGIKSADRLFGLHQSGHVSEQYVLGVIAALRPGVTELYFHPAADTGATPPDAAAQREVAILTSPRIRAALNTAGVELTNFAELARLAH